MAEDKTEKVKELMNKHELIRNIGVCAHIDHGKCISPDTRLILADGQSINAQDFYNKYKKKGTEITNNPEETIIDIRNLNIEVLSFNKKTNKTENKRLDYIWKLGNKDNLIEVKFVDGKKIKTTPEHKFLIVDKDFELIEKKAANLTEQDSILCPRELEYSAISINELKKLILNKLSKDKNYLVYLNEDYGKKLHKKIIKEGRKLVWSKTNSELKFLSFYHRIWKNRYRLIDLIKIINLFEIDKVELYNNINSINYRNTFKKTDKTSVNISLPKTYSEWQDFFYLLGMLFGDGDVNACLHNEDKEMHDEVLRICKQILNIKPAIKKYKNKCTRINLNSGLTFKKLINQLFKYPLKQKSHNISIPKIIQKLPKDILSEFIKGYMDTDGSVGIKHPISISSASREMIHNLQIELLKFNCLSSIFEKIVSQGNKLFKQWILVISGKKSLESYNTKIGFKLTHKKNKLLRYLEICKDSVKFDYVPYEVESVSYGKRGTAVSKLSNLELKPLLIEIVKNQLYLNKVKTISKVKPTEHVYDFTVPENKNFVAEGLFIHNTTFSDNLLAGAGMMSAELAGKQLVMDFHQDEKDRGITIDSANVSMVHEFEKKDHLINLIDTPGHVDFGGDVTRAMRVVDGAIVLCCAVEGIMPQTETVLKQALKERVKPVLFINKVDRLIKEVKLTPEKMQEKFISIINDVNKLIRQIAPKEYKDEWQVNVQDGSVGFGSAYHNWALNLPYMEKNKVSFKDIIDAYQNDKIKELAVKAPLHEIVLNMVIKHHPDPVKAQKYRVPKIWHGDLESEEGKGLINCDPNAPAVFNCYKIEIDKHAGPVTAGRLFSGTLKQGDEVFMVQAKKKVRVQQILIYKGHIRTQIDKAVCGNIIGLAGLKDVFSGETIASREIEPFESIKHIFEPVITKSIEPKKTADLAKMIEVLRKVGKEDPSIQIEINEETGESLLHGMGELHLEVIENRIKTEKGLDVITSPPIVVYRETVLKESQEVEGKSPNKHNKFYIKVEPLDDETYKAIKEGELPEMRMKKKDQQIVDKLVEFGWDAKEAKSIKDIYKGNVFVDNTRGIVHIGEIMEMTLDAFEQVMREGPLAKEPGTKMIVRLMDTKLHEDAIHRGPAQVIPAVRQSIKLAMMNANAVIFEPLQILQIEAPEEFMGEISKLVQNKRGQLLEMNQEQSQMIIKAKLPVAEMFGLSSDLRSATSGKGVQFLVDQVFEKLPPDLQRKAITKIRERKGLKADSDLTN